MKNSTFGLSNASCRIGQHVCIPLSFKF
uniref:Uncharacterized protein n=1 Tax=Anguilla anguilla TaxID=7936 RepID=A0A0E9R753_ANGAN